MKKKFTMGICLAVLVLSGLVISLMSCGGGGGTSGISSDSTSSSGTGTVVFLLTDAPTDYYDHIWITITEVSLVPIAHSAPPVVIYSNPSGLRLDLLEYRDEDYLLTIKKNVPAGLYAKIRLAIKDVEVEPKLGAPCNNLEIKLPSGKIDLNPQESFLVSPGGSLSIRLDIDANKSINLHKAGKSGKCIFRPVVFVDIKEGMPIGRCPKILNGTIAEIIKTNGQTTGFYLQLANDRGLLKVIVADSSKIFDENGDFVEPERLQVGDKVKVRGKFDNDGALLASLVIIGDVLDISGLINGTVDNTYLLPFTAASGEEIVGSVKVRVDPEKTLILIGCDTQVGVEYIQPGMKARVFGKLDLQTKILKAAVILLRERVIEGEVTSVSNYPSGKWITVNENGASIAVFVPTGTPIYLEGDGSISSELLCVGRQVRIFLKLEIGNPLTAALVKVQSERHEGEVIAINSSTRTLTIQLDGGISEQVYVEYGATIIESNNGLQNLRDFSDIRIGDYLIYFGLTDCQFTKPFHAFVVVIDSD